ncbi:filamentous hemagglutinin family protein [Tepidicaulis sp. LMO-SS28]|uniref:filamentous haemagglutinin family protein n=1 Tax=Tepidicaulis sp. LMO-SS28 TaxID=3447455 RepID=UPI003EE18675
MRGNRVASPVANVTASQAAAMVEAQKAARQTSNSLARATQAIQAMRAAQSAARDLALQAPGSLPNGLKPGGLVVADGATPGSDLWQGAEAPTETQADGRTVVDIDQTRSKAILTWESFNVGKETTVDFDQQGNSSWVALNRVTDPSAAPSQIAGQIKADGSVYILNRNGVIFTGSSQINTHSLIASSADIANEQFLNNGIYSAQAGGAYVPSFTDAGGLIKVEAGAEIETHAPQAVTSGGGAVILLGSEVENAGTISTPKGQALLAAGDDFALRPGYGTEENTASTTRGSEVAPLLEADSLSGTVSNSGLLFAQQGDITLAGRDVRQDGVALSTTSVNTRGTIHLLNSRSDTQGRVTLGAESFTAILPELESEETALNSQRDTLVKASDEANRLREDAATGVFDNLSLLADRLDQSRVEIVTGGDVAFEGGSITQAQGGQVAVTAGRRITTGAGALIDVSGTRDAYAPMSANNIEVNIQSNELRDSPQNRDEDYLKNQDVWIDARDLIFVPDGTGGYDGDRYYTGGGLLEVGGYLANQAHRIGEWAALGGTITLSAPEVVAQEGSVFDISGGAITYEAGYIRTSNFLGADSRIHNVGTARGDVTYYGLGSGYVREHERWNVTEVWMSPLGRGRESVRWDQGYTVGRDAGALVLSTPAAIMEADIKAGVVTGYRQMDARPDDVTDPYKLTQRTVARAGTLALGQYTPRGRTGVYETDIRIGDIADITEGLDAAALLPEERAGTLWLDADRLNGQELGGLDLATGGSIAIESGLTLADGGAVDLAAATVDIGADITARGGSITATNWFESQSGEGDWALLDADSRAHIALRDGAVLDVRGLWANTVLDASDTGKLAFLDGGDVSLVSTHDVTLEDGSLIDVSSGAAVQTGGTVLGGTGGDITLRANAPLFASSSTPSTGGTLVLDGNLRGYGVNGGGMLTVETGQSVIVGEGLKVNGLLQAGEETPADLMLDESDFQHGFSSYDINGHNGVLVGEGTEVDVIMPVLRPTDEAFQSAAYEDALETWLPDLFLENGADRILEQRGGASLALRSERYMYGGAITVEKDASLTVDPGQSLILSGHDRLSVGGILRAQGGLVQVVSAYLDNGPSSEDEEGRIEIGEEAVLDVSGLAHVATDARARRYGSVLDGGEVILGAEEPEDFNSDFNLYDTNNLFVVVREGALIDVSGASSELDLSQGPTTVASSGGTLAMRSNSGIYFDGDLRAKAGGDNAKGGALEVLLENVEMQASNATEENSVLRNITLTQTDHGSGYDAEAPTYGQARFSVETLKNAGIDHLNLWARDAILFEGDVDLALDGSLSLTAAALATPDSVASQVRLAAPYVHLAGRVNEPTTTSLNGSSVTLPYLQYDGTAPLAEGDGSLSVKAQLIDLGDGVLTFGARGFHELEDGSSTSSVELPGFSDISLTSSGDIRLTNTHLMATKELTFVSQRLYATTHSVNLVQVGIGDEGQFSGSGDPVEGAALRFRFYDEEAARDQKAPQSVYGYLTLQAPTIDQDGALYAPLGAINFSSSSIFQKPYAGVAPKFFRDLEMDVVLRSGSITSVSADGLVMPYGYTLDGENYYYSGEEVRYDVGHGLAVSDEEKQRTAGGVRFSAKTFKAEDGAIIDVSAGGELRGVGFSTGSGGSVDILNTALANAAPWHGGDSDNQVYAIVAGFDDSQAPIDPALSGDMAVGQQVTIGEGVAGLPAGTYTLLPAEYALMPGGYRVELGASTIHGTGAAVSTASGIYSSSVTVGNALTGASQSLPVTATIMSGDTVRSYAGYNETGLSEWVAGKLARFGDTRASPLLPEDVRPMEFDLQYASAGDESVFRFDGELRNAQVEGGRGGMVAFYGNDLGVVAAGEDDEEGDGYITLVDEDLNQLGATVLGLGVQKPSILGILDASGSVTIRSGAKLHAATVMLGGQGDGAVTVETGAIIDTSGRGQAGWTADNGYLLQPGSNVGLLVVGNDLMQFGAAEGTGTIRIEDDAGLYGEGTLALSAPGGLEIGDISLAASDLLLSMEDINIGEDAALAAADAEGVLSGGWQLTQSTLDGLLSLGDLESLSLQASKSINFIGSVSLDTYDDDGQSRASLRLIGPAMYGLGEETDMVSIRTDRFFWSGLGYTSGREGTTEFKAGSVAPGAVIAGGAGTGSGAFRVEANEVVFGFNGQPDDQSSNATLDRLMLGFGDVTFAAGERITSDLYGTLSVYQSKDGDTYSGGNLTLTTPVLTGQGGSEMAYRTGGNLVVNRPQDAAAVDPANLDLGAQLSLTGNSVRVDGSIIAPSGKVAIESAEDLDLGNGSLIDVAGRAVEFFDVTKHSFGGAVSLESTEGSVRQAGGGRIDLSAPHSDAGKLDATAVNGTVDLGGELVARSPEADPEGRGEGGSIRVKADTITGFAELNRRLTDGGFDYLRGFETSQGDLTLGEEVRARHIEATANGGDLIVRGTLRAGGAYAGSLYLAAANDLRVAGGATLDASGDSLKVDSYGDPIEGSNRAIINLTSRNGRLVLGDDVTLDVGAAGEARGTIDLNARRLGGKRGNDMAVDAGSGLTVSGAKRVSVNGFWTYDDAPDDPDNDGTQFIDQAYLNMIDEDSTAFIDAALANGGLQARLAGLKAAAGDAFSLRPGVEIVSAAEDGNLRIDGDLDFSGYRYGPDANPAVRGSGEAGVFVLRAGGDLTVNGSVTDGFKLPPNTPDSSYTLDFELDPGLLDGDGRLTQDFELPETLTLRSGWNLGTAGNSGSSYSLPIDINPTTATFTIAGSGGVEIPIEIVLNQGALSDTVLTAPIELPTAITDGAGVTHGPGLVEAGTHIRVYAILPPGTVVHQGNVLNLLAPLQVRSRTIPAGTNLKGFQIADAQEFNNPLSLAANTVLLKGFGISSFEGGEKVEQPIWPMALAMEQGTESWDIRLVAGADLASASSRAARTLPDQGDLILDHSYLVSTSNGVDNAVQGLSVIRTGTGDLELIAGRDYRQESRFGVYTAGTAVAGAPDLGAERAEDGTVLGGNHAEYEASAAAATALINTGGGNVLLAAGRDIYGHQPNGETDHWLWAASDTDAGNRQVWGVNPGNYRLVGSGDNQYLDLLGFDAIGTLGGGNLTVSAGGNFGIYDGVRTGETLGGLSLAVASSGWVNENGVRRQYGGGNLRLDVGGIVNNPGLASSTLSSDDDYVANLRGEALLRAGAIGQIWNTYSVGSNNSDSDPRPDEELLEAEKNVYGGLRLMQGDAQIAIYSYGDQSVSTADPSVNGVDLWTDKTEATLFSAGGNLGVGPAGTFGFADEAVPVRFSAIAAEGNIYGNSSSAFQLSEIWIAETAPDGWLEFLAGKSIYTLGLSSAYDPDLLDADLPDTEVSPARFYARDGDIYQLFYGYYGILSRQFINQAGRPAHVRAGRDIVQYGLTSGGGGSYGGMGINQSALGHYSDTDVSIIEAGRDLIHVYAQVVGGGTLEVTAGRNVYQADRGQLISRGAHSENASGTTSGGADIVVNVGMGEAGPDYQALIDAYLDPANLVSAELPLADQPNKVAKTYEGDLANWLEERYGFAGTAEEALAYFHQVLTPEQQRIFLRQVYYAELREGGREYNDAGGVRYGSYLRGRRMIETLFPEMDSEAGTSAYEGDYTMFSSGQYAGLIRTEGGGDIQMLAPGGTITIGQDNITPENGDNGILTQGRGDIRLFSQGDIALGLSRIMTTFGGDIFAWTNAGDINAGRGAKTTVVYTPPRRTYDGLGNVTLSPVVPATGAGIATLAPIAEVPAGDVDLIAPLGVIDAGEAGIRVTGNVNIAALQVLNAANIDVQGDAAGIPTVAPPNVSGALNATSTAGAAANAAEEAARSGQQAGRNTNMPSIITVEVLGYGNDGSGAPNQNLRQEKRRQDGRESQYNPDGAVRVLGNGQFTEEQMKDLTEAERRRLRQVTDQEQSML